MQKRPNEFSEFALRRQFLGVTTVGSYEVWMSLGRYLNFAGDRNHLHRHSYFEACLVLDGRGILHHDGREFELESGYLFVTSPGVVHEIVSHSVDHLCIHYLYFGFARLEPDSRSFSEDEWAESRLVFDRHLNGFIRKHRTWRSNCGHLEEHFQRLSKIDEGAIPSLWYIESEGVIRDLILKITALMSLEQEEGGGDAPQVGANLVDPRLRIALRFMEDNSDRQLAVPEVARQSGTSVRTLRRLMHQSFGCTVIQKMLDIRLRAASAHLVAHPKTSIAETSYLYDFENPSDFGRAFKRILGLSPGEFRRNNGTTFQND